MNPADLPDGEVDEYRKPVFETIDDFLKKPSIDGGGANHRMILGDAGMGKSSLLVMLWKMHLFGFWPTDVECTLLKLGTDTLERIAEISVPSRHILLLDALDEDPSFSVESGGPKARLVQLIAATTRFRKVIISCRTQFFVDEDNDPVFAKLGAVRLDGFVCPISYLSPFDDRQAKELLEKRFPNTWQRFLFRPNKAREKAMSIADVMGSLSMRPLLLSYIPFLLGDDPHGESLLDLEGVDREYEIYRLMIIRWLDREVLKIKERGTAGVVPRSEDLREVCWQVATMMRLDGLQKMPRESFEDLRKKLGASDFLAEDTLEGRALLNKDSAGNFRFAHSSIQEFLSTEFCLIFGPFIRAADLKCNLESNALMQRFYEQRLQANLRSRIVESNSLCLNDIDRWMARTLFAPRTLMFVAVRMVEMAAEPSGGGSALVYLGKKGRVDEIVKMATAILVGDLFNLSEVAELNGLPEFPKKSNISSRSTAPARRNVLVRPSGVYGSGVRVEVGIPDGVEGFDISSEMEALYKLDRRVRIDLYKLVELYRLDELDVWCSLYDLYRLGKLGELDIANIVKSASRSAAELSAGLLNLSISESRLAQICMDEFEIGWPRL